MYNGIGLTTPRGSGTNGHVQRNWALVRSGRPSNTYRAEEDTKRLDAQLNRLPNKEILDHDRKRRIEVKCLEMEEMLEKQSFSFEEIQEKVNAYRKKLLEQTEKDSQPKSELGRIDVRETHQMAAAQQEKNAKLRDAFNISEVFVDGSSFGAYHNAKDDNSKKIALQKELSEQIAASKELEKSKTAAARSEKEYDKKSERKKRKKRQRSRSSSPDHKREKRRKSKKKKKESETSTNMHRKRSRKSYTEDKTRHNEGGSSDLSEPSKKGRKRSKKSKKHSHKKKRKESSKRKKSKERSKMKKTDEIDSSHNNHDTDDTMSESVERNSSKSKDPQERYRKVNQNSPSRTPVRIKSPNHDVQKEQEPKRKSLCSDREENDTIEKKSHNEKSKENNKHSISFNRQSVAVPKAICLQTQHENDSDEGNSLEKSERSIDHDVLDEFQNIKRAELMDFEALQQLKSGIAAKAKEKIKKIEAKKEIIFHQTAFHDVNILRGNLAECSVKMPDKRDAYNRTTLATSAVCNSFPSVRSDNGNMGENVFTSRYPTVNSREKRKISTEVPDADVKPKRRPNIFASDESSDMEPEINEKCTRFIKKCTSPKTTISSENHAKKVTQFYKQSSNTFHNPKNNKLESHLQQNPCFKMDYEKPIVAMENTKIPNIETDKNYNYRYNNNYLNIRKQSGHRSESIKTVFNTNINDVSKYCNQKFNQNSDLSHIPTEKYYQCLQASSIMPVASASPLHATSSYYQTHFEKDHSNTQHPAKSKIIIKPFKINNSNSLVSTLTDSTLVDEIVSKVSTATVAAAEKAARRSRSRLTNSHSDIYNRTESYTHSSRSSRSSSVSRSRSSSQSNSRRSRGSICSSNSSTSSSRSPSCSSHATSTFYSTSRSPSIPRRRGSPSFLDRRRITSARKRPIPYHRKTPSDESSHCSSCCESDVSSLHSRSCSPAYNLKESSLSC